MQRLVSRVVAAAIAVTVGGVLGAGALGASSGLPTAGLDLREGAGGRVHVPVPAPGASSTFHITARPVAGGPSALTLVLGDAAAPAGADLALTLSDDTGAVLAAGSTAGLRGARVALGLVGDEPVTVHGTATLPESAPATAAGGTLALPVRIATAPDAARWSPGTVRRAPAGDGTATGPRLVVAAPGVPATRPPTTA
ncbi:hypothetical protein [Cellulomonas sp.]|uniref:hypothetical protein n=1 Tax=Cellulomonas sp. TaxID=40001 RepID=UPI002D6E167F|nr:hypothetical protein [Cellulomonas sp.]HYQ76406.1 hypothetical protein [Cellulomonas sp.]